MVALIGLLMASYGACSHEAHADRLMMPKGWHITVTDDKGSVVRDEMLKEVEFIIDRAGIDQNNKSAEMERRLTNDLLDCKSEIIELRKPEPGWRIAARWALWGVGISGAFVLGRIL